MNADMKRLCNAARGPIPGHYGRVYDEEVEAIVRAVLEELKAVMNDRRREPIPLGLYAEIIVDRVVG